MTRPTRYRRAALAPALAVISLLLGLVAGCAAAKTRIDRLDDLPRHTYRIDRPALAFIGDETAVAELADAVRADLEADLSAYEISDKTTLKKFYDELGTVALLQQRYDDCLALLEKRGELEEKQALALTTGLYTRAYIGALSSGAAEFDTALAQQLARMVNALPYEVVGDEVKRQKGRSEILSQALIEGRIEASIQPVLDGSKGEMSKEIAIDLLGSAASLRTYIPHAQVVTRVLGDYIAAHEVRKPDIWQAREFELTAQHPLRPVVVAIWDSGVDDGVYAPRGQMWINEAEIPENGIDDDANGFVDDLYGVAYDLHSQKTGGTLFPIGDVGAERPRLQRQMKGLQDISSNTDSDEAGELKTALARLNRDEVKPFIEGISKYGNYAHGTHVAGIAVRGNPFARVLVARITFGHTMIPELPTVELAEAEARMYREVIAYFRQQKVRVVNMSWGGSLADTESALEANNAGGSPEERRALARRIFTISRDGLYEAIRSAPDILFITSAGNSDNNVNFEEVIPSSFDLPNILSVGAVDQAGDETSFTSFGKVDVYANGFEVPSFVPGGDELKMSGTSMSSPNVSNLAAKLIAERPDISVAQLRELIVGGCEEHRAGERSVCLLNPRQSRTLLHGS